MFMDSVFLEHLVINKIILCKVKKMGDIKGRRFLKTLWLTRKEQDLIISESHKY